MNVLVRALVRHADGDYLLMQKDFRKPNYGGFYEATAGGFALKGEDALACAKRELLGETGVESGTVTKIGRFVSHGSSEFTNRKYKSSHFCNF